MTTGQLRLKDSTGRLSNQLALEFVFSPTPPAATKPLLGACTSSNTTWTTLINALGGLQPQARRTFEGGSSALPATFAASRAASDPAAGRMTVTSFKPNQDGGLPTFATSTTQQNWLRAYLNSWPLNHPGRIAIQHEPGSELASGQFTMAQWKAAVLKLGEIVQEVRAARGPQCLIEAGYVLEGPYNFDSTNTGYGQIPYGPYDWNWTAAELAKIDWVGIDPYLNLASQVSMERICSYDDFGRLNTQNRSLVKYLQATGKPVIVAEWGVTSNSQTDQAKADKIRSAWAWFKSAPIPIEAVLYFHYNLEADVTWEFLGSGETLAREAFIEILNDARA